MAESRIAGYDERLNSGQCDTAMIVLTHTFEGSSELYLQLPMGRLVRQAGKDAPDCEATHLGVGGGPGATAIDAIVHMSQLICYSIGLIFYISFHSFKDQRRNLRCNCLSLSDYPHR